MSKEGFMIEQLDKIGIELEKRLLKNKVKGKTVTVKLKYTDFTSQTRSKTISEFIQLKKDFWLT